VGASTLPPADRLPALVRAARSATLPLYVGGFLGPFGGASSPC
jgi:hypothetical protein